MRSFSVVLNENKTRSKTWFSKHSIQLDKNKDYKIELINMETYYSLPNIDNSYNCLLIRPVLLHNGITLLFLKVVITLKILMSSFNEK